MSKETDHFERVLQLLWTKQEVIDRLCQLSAQHKKAQKATDALNEMLQKQRQPLMTADGLIQMLEQQKNALETIGGLEPVLSQHQDALTAIAALGDRLSSYQATLAANGGLSRILAGHLLAAEVAAEFHPAITVDPEVRSGQPCLNGSRMTIYDVLEYLCGEMSDAKILEDFPYLTPADLELCRAFGTVLEARLAALPD